MPVGHDAKLVEIVNLLEGTDSEATLPDRHPFEKVEVLGEELAGVGGYFFGVCLPQIWQRLSGAADVSLQILRSFPQAHWSWC